MVLWLLMLRGIGIELRAHMDNPVWRRFFDVIFSVASIRLAIFFGAALGNVIRGVPLNAEGYFFEPLGTHFRLGPHPGILDWYTVMAGVVALVTFTAHGALQVTRMHLDAQGEATAGISGVLSQHHWNAGGGGLRPRSGCACLRATIRRIA
jgi:cytochrome bd-type quinol oxidase subunit 2